MRRLIIAAICVTFSNPTLAQTAGGTVTIEASEAEIQTDQLATREDRLAVKPLNWDEARGAGLRTDALQEAEQLDPALEASGSASPGNAEVGADAEAREAFPEDWKGLESSVSLEDLSEDGNVGIRGTKDVFSQYCENCGGVNLRHPQKAIGKLFTSSGSCTASVVSGNGIIVTAAHCCYNRGAGRWNTNFRFAPAYRDGFSPYGLFNYSTATILTRWINVGDRKSDVCVIKLRKNSQNRAVTYYTGWLGRSWNYGTKQVHHAVGYPGNIGGGNKQELCVSESFNPSSGCGGSSVLNTGCSMTYGASGGPWVRNYRNGSQVNSVVSGYDSTSCTGSFGKTFNGPRFTSSNIVKVCNTIGC